MLAKGQFTQGLW